MGITVNLQEWPLLGMGAVPDVELTRTTTDLSLYDHVGCELFSGKGGAMLSPQSYGRTPC